MGSACIYRSLLPAMLLVFFSGASPAQETASAPQTATTAATQPGPTFTVADANLPQKLSIIIYGDTRFTDPNDRKAADPEARRALVGKIAEEHPDALVITGDVPYRGTVSADYAEYRQETAAWRAEKLRVYPVLGNHELKGGGKDDGLENWWTAFPELKNHRWYSVALGSSVYIVGLDSNSDLTPGSPQRVWLEQQIAHLPSSVKFVFLAMHHPPVADIQTIFEVDHNPRPNEIALRDYLAEVAPHARAKFIVAAGHIHNYERFEVDGVTYLVSGGGGAHPYPVQRTAPDQYQGTDFPIFHYVLFHLDGKKLNAITYKLDFPVGSTPGWHTEDQFSLTAK